MNKSLLRCKTPGTGRALRGASFLTHYSKGARERNPVGGDPTTMRIGKVTLTGRLFRANQADKCGRRTGHKKKPAQPHSWGRAGHVARGKTIIGPTSRGQVSCEMLRQRSEMCGAFCQSYPASTGTQTPASITTTASAIHRSGGTMERALATQVFIVSSLCRIGVTYGPTIRLLCRLSADDRRSLD